MPRAIGPADLPTRATTERGVKGLFFAYFSLVGAMSPYMGLYYAAWGLSIAQISVLLTIPQVMRVIAPPIWGAWADRGGRQGTLLRISAAGTLVVLAAMAVVQGSYALLIVVVGALSFFTAAQGPIGETLALAAAAGVPGAYGRLRQWGSIGFILAVSASGPLLDGLGVRSLPYCLCLLALQLVAVSWWLSRSPLLASRDEAGAEPVAVKARPVWPRLREPHLAAFFLSCALMMFAHAALYGFYSIYLDRHGYSKSLIGAVWSLGVLAEIALFRWQHGLFERFGALALLAFSLAVAALRFALIGWGDGHWLIVVVSQLMHAVTFGVHHSAAMSLLHRWFAADEQARAQALYVTLGYGLGGALGGVTAGWWWSTVSPASAFYVAALAAALGFAAVAACRHFEYAAQATTARPARRDPPSR